MEIAHVREQVTGCNVLRDHSKAATITNTTSEQAKGCYRDYESYRETQVLINYLKEQSSIAKAGVKICNSTGSNEGVTKTLALKLSDDKHKMKMPPLTSTARAQQI